MEANGQVSQEKLAEAFDRLDCDNTGFITKSNLKELMGSDYDDKEATEMIAR
jgi:Ca2+-binding EF-hand superfamily protein